MNDKLQAVEDVLKDADKHRYSVSKVFSAYNLAMGKNDQPQTCSSCLRNRVRELRKWYADNTKESFDAMVSPEVTAPEELARLGITEIPVGTPDDQETPPRDEERPDDQGQDPGKEKPIVDVVRLHVEATYGTVYFEPGVKDPCKGKAYLPGGGAIKPGKYITTDNRELAVQPGGKASLRVVTENDIL